MVIIVCRNDHRGSSGLGAPAETTQRGGLAGEGLLQYVLYEHVVVFRLLVRLSHVQLSLAPCLPVHLHVRTAVCHRFTMQLKSQRC